MHKIKNQKADRNLCCQALVSPAEVRLVPITAELSRLLQE